MHDGISTPSGQNVALAEDHTRDLIPLYSCHGSYLDHITAKSAARLETDGRARIVRHKKGYVNRVIMPPGKDSSSPHASAITWAMLILSGSLSMKGIACENSAHCRAGGATPTSRPRMCGRSSCVCFWIAS